MRLAAPALALLLAACSGVVGEVAPDASAADAPDGAPPDRPAAIDAPTIDAPALDRATPVDLPPVAIDDGAAAYDRPDVPVVVDPCSRATLGNGLYCGAGIGADAAVLFECRDGRTASQTRCERGCDPQPPGVNDRCVASDPCARATFGNGAYCGAGIGGDAAVIYNCQDGYTASQTRCERGCDPQPPGVADRCAPPPVSGRCCLLRPPGSFVRGFSACGRGGSHYGIDSGAGLGTAIAAGISGTVISVATGNPNCPYNAATDSCPSSCVNRFNYVKIRSDCGDPGDGSRDLIVYYLHVDRLAPGVGAGAHVNQGDVIAYVGNSGCSSGPHVHLEIVPVARGANAVLNTCASVDPASRYCP